MGANDWEKDNPPAKVFNTDLDKVEQEWQRFMDLEGYSDQTKKLKSAGFQKFLRWQYGVEKPTKTTKAGKKPKAKAKGAKVPKEGSEKPVLAEAKPKRTTKKTDKTSDEGSSSS